MRFLLFLLLCSGMPFTIQAKQKSPDNPETLIAFGSCAHEYETVPAFNTIADIKAEIFVWLGDMIYADTRDMAVMKKKYDEMKKKAEYQNLLNSMPVIGVWDDHDFGINDGGKHYIQKDESKLLALDFLDVAEDDPRNFYDGLYTSYDLVTNEKLVKIILLDTRYFRDTLFTDNDTRNLYLLNETGDILGEEQWAWLEKELSTQGVDLFIIGSSIQLIAKDHYYEKWANFPASRARLLGLLKIANPTPVLVISGDRHIAEVSQMDVEGLDYPLIDFTSSGLTHTWKEYFPEPNSYRMGDLIVQKNFGLISIEWDDAGPKISFKVKGIKGEDYLEYSYKY